MFRVEVDTDSGRFYLEVTAVFIVVGVAGT